MPQCPKSRKTKKVFVTFDTDYAPKNRKSLSQRRTNRILTVKVEGLKDRFMRWSAQSVRSLRGSIMSEDVRVQTLFQTVKAKACSLVNGIFGVFA
jgi:hypothetical protein